MIKLGALAALDLYYPGRAGGAALLYENKAKSAQLCSVGA